MSGLEFFQTRMWVRFFEVDVPDLIKAIKRIAQALDGEGPNELERVALKTLVDYVNLKGGVRMRTNGKPWTGLGDAYMMACNSLGVAPKMVLPAPPTQEEFEGTMKRVYAKDNVEELQKIIAEQTEQIVAKDAALESFVSAIGGVRDRGGRRSLVPADDESWVGLADAYAEACKALGVEMEIAKDG